MFVYFRTGAALQLALALSVNLIKWTTQQLPDHFQHTENQNHVIYFVAHRTKYECAFWFKKQMHMRMRIRVQILVLIFLQVRVRKPYSEQATNQMRTLLGGIRIWN